jgi:predicted transcriptional regulator
MLSPALAEAHADRTSKTLSRDLNRLKESGFIEHARSHARAKLERVRGMRPLVNGVDLSKKKNREPPR